MQVLVCKLFGSFKNSRLLSLIDPSYFGFALVALQLTSLVACGGGSGSSKSSSSSSVDPSQLVIISGRITYDFIPHNNNFIGLDYDNIETRPARAVQVELRNSNNSVLDTSVTDGDGNYNLYATKNTRVRVRVKAQLLKTLTPSWNFSVRDNTNNNSLYVMDGSLVSSGDTDSVRNLHAASGWTGSAYTQTRVAAPFAILDGIYSGVEALNQAGNNKNFPPLDLRWSSKNKTADGNTNLGEIGTSYFSGDAIYILGDKNNDTDEYDAHVILHEWGHYIESAFSRTDSIGGDHLADDKLDMRVAMSEGFSNAFSAIMLDDAAYRDSLGDDQADGFWFDVAEKNSTVRGWYSEASVQSILYNYYFSDQGKIPKVFSDLWQVFGSENYIDSESFTSIYLFSAKAKALQPAHVDLLNDLLAEQNILANDEFGTGESNSGGYAATLPVYKNISANNSAVNVCSSNRFGVANKLGVAQFLKISATSGVYRIIAEKTSGDVGNSDPDIYIYKQGVLQASADDVAIDAESLMTSLDAGTYIIEILDAKNLNANANTITRCFDVSVEQL